MDKEFKKTSKFLSLVLRHKPETIGLKLDDQGWVAVDELLRALGNAKRPISVEELNRLVAENEKQRFVIRNGKIRANQGHSLDVNLTLKPTSPPNILFHGTATRFLALIRSEGLQKMKRQHVHLSSDVQTANKVGIRHGKLAILEVDAAKMHTHGYEFFLSENRVWLTNAVPWQYINERANSD